MNYSTRKPPTHAKPFVQRGGIRRIGTLVASAPGARDIDVTSVLVPFSPGLPATPYAAAIPDSPEHVEFVFRPRGLQKKGVVRLTLQELVSRCMGLPTTGGLTVTTTISSIGQREFSWVNEMVIPMKPLPGAVPDSVELSMERARKRHLKEWLKDERYVAPQNFGHPAVETRSESFGK